MEDKDKSEKETGRREDKDKNEKKPVGKSMQYPEGFGCGVD